MGRAGFPASGREEGSCTSRDGAPVEFRHLCLQIIKEEEAALARAEKKAKRLLEQAEAAEVAAREAEAALDAAAAGAAAATLHAKAKRQLTADRQGRAGVNAESGANLANGGAQPLANGSAGGDGQPASEGLREASPATANDEADRQANGAGEAGSSVQVGLVVV